MAEKLVFDSAVEGLFHRGLGDRLNPALRAELKTLGIDLTRKLPPAITREAWYRALNASARLCYPERSRADGLREIGVRLMKGVEETFFGKAMTVEVTFDFSTPPSARDVVSWTE